MLTNIEISMGYLWISFIFFILIFILFFNKYKYKKVKERYPSGEPRRSYYLKKGKKQGTETIYYKSGEINKRKKWNNGTQQGRATTFYKEYILLKNIIVES